MTNEVEQDEPNFNTSSAQDLPTENPYIGLTCHGEVEPEPSRHRTILSAPKVSKEYHQQKQSFHKKEVADAGPKNTKGNIKKMPEGLSNEAQKDWHETRIVEVDEVINEIDVSILAIKAKNPEGYKEVPWYCKARDKRNHLLQEKGRLILFLDKIHKVISEDFTESYARIFMEQAEETLPKHIYDALIRATSSRV